MSEFKYEIKKSIAILSADGKGWTKELNVVSWNDKEPKLDIRSWNHEGKKMGKGITLNNEEAKKLVDELNKEFGIMD